MEKSPDKARLREEVARLIDALSEDERRQQSQAACERLAQVPEVRDATTILLYAPLPDELDVWPALHAFRDAGKRIVLPKCRPQEHELTCIEVADLKNDLVRCSYNILEPKSNDGIDVGELDAIVVPARAFDRDANRLGRGAGYYDRLLSTIRPDAFTCGIAFDCQIFDTVPTAPHDVPLDAIVTNSALFRRASD
jgi:5-formyltetrahydrofolate cyclo-ligase